VYVLSWSASDLVRTTRWCLRAGLGGLLAPLAVRERIAQVPELCLPAKECKALRLGQGSRRELVAHTGKFLEDRRTRERKGHTPTVVHMPYS
jgi:hypothetical protein